MLKEFFVNETPKFLFKQFGLIHNIFILISIIGVILVYKNRNKISKISKNKSKKILKIIAIILLLNMIIFTVGFLSYGVFDYKRHLPFHLCFIANYMFMYGILFEKEWILKYTVFLSFIGPIPAILWPDFISTIDNFEWWQYVISHHVFIIASFFSYYALAYKIEKKDFIKVFIFTNDYDKIMPELYNYSVKEASIILDNLGIKYKINNEGYVTNQSVSSGTNITDDVVVELN